MFRMKSEPTAADRLAALRDRVGPAGLIGSDAALAAKAYGPIARDRAVAAAGVAVDAASTARDRAAAAAEWAQPRLEHARDAAEPYAKKARQKARPYVDNAVEAMAPRVQDAVDSVAPRVDATRDHIVDDLLPKLSAAVAAVVAASESARDRAESAIEKGHDVYETAAGTAVEAGGRTSGAVAVLTGAKVAKTVGRKRRVALVLAALAAIGGAVAYFLNRKPQDDPWATPISTPPRPAYSAGTGSGSNGSVSDLKAKASGVADAAGESAKDTVSDVADSAKDTVSDVEDAASGAADDAKDTAADVKDSATGDATS